MIRIALDSSCLNARRRHTTLNALDEMEQRGEVEIITSTVNLREQIATNHHQAYRERYLKRIAEKRQEFEVGHWNVSLWGQAVWGDKTVSDSLIQIFGNPTTFSKSDSFDIWLLETAVAHRCNYFLTTNKRDFIENGRREAIEALGIKTREPNDDFLKELRGLITSQIADIHDDT